MSHNVNLKKAGMPSVETLTRRILRVWDSASVSDIESGVTWYGEAQELAQSLASAAGSVEHAAVVIAHLSPRTAWTRNVASAVALVNETDLPPGTMGALVERAAASLDFSDPFDSFGTTALKTRNFARNICGDTEAATVDVWAARVAGVDQDLLGRKGVYEAVAHAYRLAARRAGVEPTTMQATTWIVARNGRAS